MRRTKSIKWFSSPPWGIKIPSSCANTSKSPSTSISVLSNITTAPIPSMAAGGAPSRRRGGRAAAAPRHARVGAPADGMHVVRGREHLLLRRGHVLAVHEDHQHVLAVHEDHQQHHGPHGAHGAAALQSGSSSM